MRCLAGEEAGLLALELAKETQGRIAEGMHFGDKDQVVYEALLSAGKEFPDEVTQIALELCARRDEPQHAIQRAIEAEEQEAKQREEWRKNHPEEEQSQAPYSANDVVISERTDASTGRGWSAAGSVGRIPLCGPGTPALKR